MVLMVSHMKISVFCVHDLVMLVWTIVVLVLTMTMTITIELEMTSVKLFEGKDSVLIIVIIAVIWCVQFWAVVLCVVRDDKNRSSTFIIIMI